jgi:type VI protein secretion system component Hcp
MPIFMQYGDIRGWATDKGHAGWIPVASAQFGPQGARGGTVKEIQITRTQDGSSSALLRASLTGEPETAIIDFVNSGGRVYLSVELTGTLITYVPESGHEHGHPQPEESIMLSFKKIEFSIKGLPPGTPDASGLWDFGFDTQLPG